MATIDDVYNLITDQVVPNQTALFHLLQDGLPEGSGPISAFVAEIDSLLHLTTVDGPAYRIKQIQDAITPETPGAIAAQVADLHNLYSILVAGFPDSVEAGLIPDDSFYVLIYRAVRRTWTAP